MTPPSPQILAYQDQYFEALVRLWKQCGLYRPYNDPKTDVALAQESSNCEIFLAKTGDSLVGCVMVGHDGHRGWFYYLGVDPNHRKQAIATALVRKGEAWLRGCGVPKVQLMIRQDNLPVKQFYASLGYEPNPCHLMQSWLKDSGAPSINPPEGGKLRTIITYLAMETRPTLKPVHPPHRAQVALLRAHRPSVGFYRFLYEGVGVPWLWWERTAMADSDLAKIINDEKVEIYVLYVEGSPAGYFELDRRAEPIIELAYFGLLPEYVGRALGPYFLYSAIELAWRYEPERLEVNTCTLDHPKALALYQRHGFIPYRQETKDVPDPRLLGLIPSEIIPRQS